MSRALTYHIASHQAWRDNVPLEKLDKHERQLTNNQNNAVLLFTDAREAIWNCTSKTMTQILDLYSAGLDRRAKLLILTKADGDFNADDLMFLANLVIRSYRLTPHSGILAHVRQVAGQHNGEILYSTKPVKYKTSHRHRFAKSFCSYTLILRSSEGTEHQIPIESLTDTDLNFDVLNALLNENVGVT